MGTGKLLALGAWLTTSVAAAQVAPSVPDATSAVSPSTQGLLIAIDPVTRQWRMPTAEEARALTQPTVARAAPVAPAAPMTIMLGGRPARKAVIDPSLDASMVVSRAGDGTLTMDCVPTSQVDQVMADGVRGEMHGKGRAAGEPLDVR